MTGTPGMKPPYRMNAQDPERSASVVKGAQRPVHSYDVPVQLSECHAVYYIYGI